MSDLPKRSSLADGLEALSPPSSRTSTVPGETGRPESPPPWKLLPAPASLGRIAARKTEPTPHAMTALAWLPPVESKLHRISDQERFLPSAWQELNASLIAPLEAEPMPLSDSLGRSWWVLCGGPWAPLELLLQAWPTPPESVLADWKSQQADWEVLGARFPSNDSNRSKDEKLENHIHGIAVEDPSRWWVDRQGVLLPCFDLWALLSQAAGSLQATSESAAREKERRSPTPGPGSTTDRSLKDLRTAPQSPPNATAVDAKPKSKPQAIGASLPSSRRKSGNRNRTTLFWVAAIAVGLLGLLVSRTFQSDSTPAITQRTKANQEPTEVPGATDIQPAPLSTSDPANASDPLDLRGLSPTAETAQSLPGLEVSSPSLFPEGDLKTKLDRLLSGSPGEPLANSPTTDMLPDESVTQTDSPSEMRDPDSADPTSPDGQAPGVAPDPAGQPPTSLEDRSIPLENLPLKSKWILRDRGLDPLLSLALDLEDTEGWQWNRMPVALEAGKVVRVWGGHKDHPEAGGMVIQASLRTGRVWQVEVDVGWSPTPETPPVRLAIGQADQWLSEVQSGLRWHDQALQQLRQTRNLTSNSSQRSLLLDQIRTLEGQQRTLKDLEARWQKVAILSQVFYDQQILHLRWQSGATDAASSTVLQEPP